MIVLNVTGEKILQASIIRCFNSSMKVRIINYRIQEKKNVIKC